jgi:hypothetical protein
MQAMPERLSEVPLPIAALWLLRRAVASLGAVDAGFQDQRGPWIAALLAGMPDGPGNLRLTGLYSKILEQ